MRITVKREELQKALAKVQAAIPAKSTLPILSSVLLTAKHGQLQLVGSDLETAIIATCPAKISRAGGIAVPPGPLAAMLKQVGADTLTLAVKTVVKRWMAKEYRRNEETLNNDEVEVERSSSTTSLLIEAGAATLTLSGNVPEDFPPVPQLKGKPITITGLDRALKEVSYAVAKEESRPVLAGICLTPVGGKIEAVAADGFRLAIASARCKGSLPEQTILPARAAKLVAKLLPGDIRMFVWGKDRDKAVGFQQKGDITIITTPIEGTYPAYDQLVPKGGKACQFSRDEMKKAVRTVMAIEPTGNNVWLRSKGKSVIVSGQNGEGVSSEVKVGAKGVIKAGFNGKYLLDLLAVAPEQMIIRMADSSRPAVVRTNGSTHVLMPMFVDW